MPEDWPPRPPFFPQILKKREFVRNSQQEAAELSILGDIGSCNKIEVNRYKKACPKNASGYREIFLLGTLGKTIILCGTTMILW